MPGKFEFEGAKERWKEGEVGGMKRGFPLAEGTEPRKMEKVEAVE